MYNRLISFIQKHDILYNKQFGFRKNHSTETAIIELVSKLTDAIDKNKFTAGIFLDLSKAFDTVNHSIIITKLQHYGIRGVALEWFKNYLANRDQVVKFNNSVSTSFDPCTAELSLLYLFYFAVSFKLLRSIIWKALVLEIPKISIIRHDSPLGNNNHPLYFQPTF